MGRYAKKTQSRKSLKNYCQIFRINLPSDIDQVTKNILSDIWNKSVV